MKGSISLESNEHDVAPIVAPEAPYCSQSLPRIILDTNAWLDWLVFDDPRMSPWKAAHAEQRITLIASPESQHELEIVLPRGKFRLTEKDVQRHLATHRALCQIYCPQYPLPKAPRCKDTEDQKFLELAVACKAAAIITRDKALLKLNRAMMTRFGTTIQKPEAGWAF